MTSATAHVRARLSVAGHRRATGFRRSEGVFRRPAALPSVRPAQPAASPARSRAAAVADREDAAAHAPSALSHAVAQVRDAVALDDRHRPVERVRRTRHLVEDRTAAAEEHGREVDPDLVEQAGLEALASDLPAVDADDLSPAISVATSIARSIPSVTNVDGASSRGAELIDRG